MDTLKKVLVRDSSCTATHPIRKHTVLVNGEFIEVTFTYGQQTLLDFDVAMKFNKEGFILLDPDSNREVTTPAQTDELIRIKIGEDEIVAKYEELTDTALKMRAAVIPGGEKMLLETVEREEVILFLMGARNDADQPEPEPEPQESTIDAETADVVELSKRIPNLPDPSVPKALGVEDMSEVE
ncbi:MAG: hypothetical protein E6Q97_09940 [Desulfurellales bacterium]|nr:MAG: hypothetical protein E6Q97_09940 [Desulfurellales bacterium]